LLGQSLFSKSTVQINSGLKTSFISLVVPNDAAPTSKYVLGIKLNYLDFEKAAQLRDRVRILRQLELVLR
jgi:hypothetical protein